MKPAITQFLKGEIEPLRERAKAGEIDAIKELVVVARHLCLVVEEIESQQLGCVVQMARRVTEWPMVVGGNYAASRTELEARVERLQVGKGRTDAHIVAPEKRGPNVADLRTAAHAAVDQAASLIRAAQRNKKSSFSPSIHSRVQKIGLLKRDNRTEYGQLVWDVIIDQCGGDVLNDQNLCGLGQSAFDSYLADRKKGITQRRVKREETNWEGAEMLEHVAIQKAQVAAKNKQRGSIKAQVMSAFRYRFVREVGKSAP